MARTFASANGNYINVGDHAALHLTTLSLFAWGYFLDNTAEHELIMQDNGQPSFTTGYLLGAIVHASNFVVNFQLQNVGGSSSTNCFGSTVLSTNTWYAIGATYNNGTTTATVYLNGAQDGTNSAMVSTSYAGTPDGLTLGAYLDAFFNPSGTSTLNGRMADASVWNVILSAGEMLSLGKGARPYTIRPSALVGYWPIDGLQSPEPDFSGNAFNGTITGSVTLAAGPPFMQFTPRWPQEILPFDLPAAFTLMPQIVT